MTCVCLDAGVLLPGQEPAPLLTMSTLTEEGVMQVKQTACDRLLATRVEAKLQVTCHQRCERACSMYSAESASYQAEIHASCLQRMFQVTFHDSKRCLWWLASPCADL